MKQFSQIRNCCICRKILDTTGNNPFGTIDATSLKVIAWGKHERCCDECKVEYVDTGKQFMLKAKSILDQLDFEDADVGKALVQQLLTKNIISHQMYEYILVNWYLLTGM